jgi:hypothetical protein
LFENQLLASEHKGDVAFLAQPLLLRTGAGVEKREVRFAETDHRIETNAWAAGCET